MLKLIGCLCIIISCTAFGFLKALELNNRIRYLEKFRRLLMLLKGEISYSRSPMAEAFMSIAQRQDGDLKKLCLNVSKEISMHDGRRFDDIWKDALMNIIDKSILEKKDMDEIYLIGDKIANQDYEMQIAAINLEIQYFDERIIDLKRIIFQKQKIYRALGVFGGLMISIILL